MTNDHPAARRDRTDIWSTIAAAAIAAVGTVFVTVVALFDLFAVDGVAATVRLDDVSADLPLGPDGSAVAADIREVSFIATDIPALSAAAFAGAILVTAVSSLIVIACILRICLNLMWGAAFTRSTTRAITVAAVTIILGTVLNAFGNMLGANGALAAVGDGTLVADTSTGAGYWIAMFAGIGLGAVAVAFRAGERLQRDTEGLV